MAELASATRDRTVMAVGEQIGSLALVDAADRLLAVLDVVPPAAFVAGRYTFSAATPWALDTGIAAAFRALDHGGQLVASGTVGADLELSDPRIVAGDVVAVTVTVGWT